MPRGKSTKVSELTEVEVEGQSPEGELMEFLENLGPSGISEISLYRIKDTGKQVFLEQGPPAQFTEQYVLTKFGGGDYMVRSRLNGKWFRSKNFSVEGMQLSSNGHSGAQDQEIEKIKVRMQEAELAAQADRRDREQRMHELQLAMIQNQLNHGSNSNNNIADIISAVKSLKDMSSGQDEVYKSVERLFTLSAKLNDLKNGTAGGEGGGGWWDWLRPIATQAGTMLLPRVLPFLNNGQVPPTPPPAPQTPPVAEVRAPTDQAAIAPAVPEPAPAAGVDNPADDTETYLTQKRDALSFALSMARMNRTPEIYADMAVEQTETSGNPFTARFIAEIMKAESFDKWFAELQQLDPAVITQQNWFRIFYDYMRERVSGGAPDSEPEA